MSDEMLHFCHRDYFRLFRVSVAEYGEILTAQAFRGIKRGNVQRGYDIVEISKEIFREVLSTTEGIDSEHLVPPDGDIRIEVKSRFDPVQSGNANIINLSPSKIKESVGMTHLAVVLVRPGSRTPNRPKDEEGRIADAWLLTRDRAIAMLEPGWISKPGLSIAKIRALIAAHNCDIIDIKLLLESAALTPLLETLATAT